MFVRVSGRLAAQLTDFYRNLHFSLYPHDWAEEMVATKISITYLMYSTSLLLFLMLPLMMIVIIMICPGSEKFE